MTQAKDDTSLGTLYARGRPPQEPKRVLPRGMLTFIALAGFAAVIWYAYPREHKAYQDVDIPVITADNTPYKFKPEDPGGMDIRHQDSTVFDPLENKSPDTVEKLRPPAEQPMSKDKAVELARAQDTPAVEDKPARLDLGMQMKTLPDGTEKIVTAPEVKPVTATPAHAVSAKRAPPQVIHNAPVKTAAAPIPKPAPVKTAAADKTAAAAIKPDATETASGVYIQLGAFRELSAARREWSALQKKFPQYFSNLTMRTERVDLGAKGVYNRLQAGRLSREDAKKICEAMKSVHSAGCIIVR
ncbi:MAG: hypothetical protein GC185_06185 [Alphaproteobacteria bacterium]|nr:hypothetical protein [Alphaproteobacteria bacterium]